MSEPEFQTQVLTELRGINQRLGHLEVEVEFLKTEVGQVKADLSLSTQRMDKWEERFFQLSRDNLITARTVIVAAASVVIFGSLLQNADAIIGAVTKLSRSGLDFAATIVLICKVPPQAWEIQSP